MVEPEVRHDFFELPLRIDGARELRADEVAQQSGRIAHLKLAPLLRRHLRRIGPARLPGRRVHQRGHGPGPRRVVAHELAHRQADGREGGQASGRGVVGDALGVQLAVEPGVAAEFEHGGEVLGAGAPGRALEQVQRRPRIGRCGERTLRERGGRREHGTVHHAEEREPRRSHPRSNRPSDHDRRSRNLPRVPAGSGRGAHGIR